MGNPFDVFKSIAAESSSPPSLVSTSHAFCPPLLVRTTPMMYNALNMLTLMVAHVELAASPRESFRTLRYHTPVLLAKDVRRLKFPVIHWDWVSFE